MRRALAVAAALAALRGDAARRATSDAPSAGKAAAPWSPGTLHRVDRPCAPIDLGECTSIEVSLSLRPSHGFDPSIPGVTLYATRAVVIGLGDYVWREEVCPDPTSARQLAAALRTLALTPTARGDPEGAACSIAFRGDTPRRATPAPRDCVAALGPFLRANPSPLAHALYRHRNAAPHQRASITATNVAPFFNPHQLRTVDGVVHADGWFALRGEWTWRGGRFSPAEARGFVKWLHLQGRPELEIRDCEFDATVAGSPWSLALAWDEATHLGATSLVLAPHDPACARGWPTAAGELE